MLFLNIFILIISVYDQVHSANAAPCKVEDTDCMKTLINVVMKEVIGGLPAIGIESSDPIHHDVTNASLSGLKVVFTNLLGYGLKKCFVTNVRSRTGLISLDMTCPALEMTAKYELNGQLIILPVHGEGDADFKGGKVLISMDANYKKVQKSDGKNHLQFKLTKFKSDAVEPMSFDLTNLFNNQKELSETFLKFTNENWKPVSELLLDPVLLPSFELLIKRMNKYFATVKVYEDLLLD